MSKRTISDQSIFGEYKRAEDRVTAALLHIMNIGGPIVVERLFGDKFDIPANLISIIPQSYHGNSVPDGELECNCKFNIFIESKIVPDVIDEKQLQNHISLTNPAENKYLIYLTPDMSAPTILNSFNVEWMSWDTIIERLTGIIADGLAGAILKYLIEQFILLVKHLVRNKLPKQSKRVVKEQSDESGKEERVIIVGGHWGENVALDYGFYACQPYRYFKPARYMAFYHQNRIKYLFEIIGNPVESERLDKISKITTTNYFTAKEPHYDGSSRKYFELKRVKTFKSEIVNDKKDKNNNPCAFTQGQTYTTYDRIINAIKTSQL